MIKLRAINQSTEESFYCPQSWDETPTRTFQRIATEWDWQNFVKLFSIVSGIDYTAIRESTDGKLEIKLIAAVQYIIKSTQEWDKIQFPKHLNYNGRKVALPKPKLTIGQSIAVKQAMQAYAERYKDNLEIRPFVKDFFFDGLISYAASVYLQPIITKSPFDSYAASDIEQEILKMPITEIYPIGFFLLIRSYKHGSSSTTVLKRLRHLIKAGLVKIYVLIARTKIGKWLRLQKRKGSNPTRT